MIEIEAKKYLSFYCLFLIGNFDLLLDAMLMTEIRSKYLDFMYPVITDSYIVVIKNDLDKVHDYTLFYGILNHEVWLVLIILCLLPSIIIAIQELYTAIIAIIVSLHPYIMECMVCVNILRINILSN